MARGRVRARFIPDFQGQRRAHFWLAGSTGTPSSPPLVPVPTTAWGVRMDEGRRRGHFDILTTRKADDTSNADRAKTRQSVTMQRGPQERTRVKSSRLGVGRPQTKRGPKVLRQKLFCGYEGSWGGGELANYVVISSSVCHRMCFSFVWEGATRRAESGLAIPVSCCFPHNLVTAPLSCARAIWLTDSIHRE